MEDSEIIELFWNRDEDAIRQTDLRYGRYLKSIARNIVGSFEESKEIVNDTYLKTWETIPPKRPSFFSAYLSRITRSLSIDRLRRMTRKKRSTGEYDLSFSELEECLSDHSAADEYEYSLLKDALNSFLRSYPEQSRNLFLCRYFFFDSLKEAAETCHMSEAAAKTQLFRMRKALRDYLIKEGFSV